MHEVGASVEEMAGVIAPPSVNMGFKQNARLLRNELAHNSEVQVQNADFDQLTSFSSHLALRLVGHAVAPGVDDRSFRKTFREHVLKELTA
jgi:hypothetical protein